MSLYATLQTENLIFTLYPEDLKWQPRFVKVDFIRMQKALSHVGFPDTRSTLACISDVTGQQTENRKKKEMIEKIDKKFTFLGHLTCSDVTIGRTGKIKILPSFKQTYEAIPGSTD